MHEESMNVVYYKILPMQILLDLHSFNNDTIIKCDAANKLLFNQKQLAAPKCEVIVNDWYAM